MTKDRRSFVLCCAAGAVLTAAVGIAAIRYPIGDPLARFSYDLPFVVRNSVPEEVVLIYIDSKVKASLGEPTDVPLNRRFHTKLVERLTKEGAGLIFYDLLFDDPKPEADAAFADAIRRHGKVVLVAENIKSLQGNAFTQVTLPPTEPLKSAAAGWGLANLKPDADSEIREIYGGVELFPSASWVAATLLDAKTVRDPGQRLTPKWLNYYCSPNNLRSLNFDHALNGEELPVEFRGKIVIVGGRPTVGAVDAAQDAFGNPYSRFGGPLATGSAIHGFSLLNLLRGDWLQRASWRMQLLLAAVYGCLLAVGLLLLRPWTAILAAAVAAIVLFSVSVYFQHFQRVWWSWAVPAIIQTPMALGWGLTWRYLLESRKRKRIRNAFSVYLSPYLADRIADSDFDLALGGKRVEATVMFTDIAGFTPMSEKLPPEEVSTILTTYFTRTTRHILERDGTIIKYLGDGVMAVWGAPLPNANHCRDAVMAACKIIDEGKTEIAGRTLHTRVGINTGPVLAGNLGSEFRFDYATIGATTNLASRLESLNKQLGTQILITDATRQSLPKDIVLRYIGRFVLVGTSEPVQVYEVLGVQAVSGWPDLFAQALEAWTRQEFASANALFQKVSAIRGAPDGPSEFYLSQLTREPRQPWTDAVIIDSK